MNIHHKDKLIQPALAIFDPTRVICGAILAAITAV
ncbi:conserved hypothetical protein [Shewanella baltica OS195]|uniref:Uncharacterized protein n=1 Tax=Shewanella baltica (strain OS195) TaxID=399599 RepID=A9L4U4_SHEB9|nr:conserved hypothetical protein [Shewanella baltica OS195]AEG12450.1 hypothetical protein Sbal175_3214 [Shewanella baltica BA175]